MTQRFEYEFVRLGEGWFGVRKTGREQYQETIRQYARQGWRLVQIFAPSIGAYGSSLYYELIFERPIEP